MKNLPDYLVFKEVDGILFKYCHKCDKFKIANESFGPAKKGKRGFNCTCRSCHSPLFNETSEHREKRLSLGRANRLKNADVVKMRSKKWYIDNKQRALEQSKERYETNKTHILQKQKLYRKNRRKSDVEFRIKCYLRSRTIKALKRDGGVKNKDTVNLLGCSIDFLKSYIESLWDTNMNWQNYGRYYTDNVMTWHIDHIRPCASFDLTDPEQQKACFHWSNLQPMWAIENIRKGAKV